MPLAVAGFAARLGIAVDVEAAVVTAWADPCCRKRRLCWRRPGIAEATRMPLRSSVTKMHSNLLTWVAKTDGPSAHGALRSVPVSQAHQACINSTPSRPRTDRPSARNPTPVTGLAAQTGRLTTIVSTPESRAAASG